MAKVVLLGTKGGPSLRGEGGTTSVFRICLTTHSQLQKIMVQFALLIFLVLIQN